MMIFLLTVVVVNTIAANYLCLLIPHLDRLSLTLIHESTNS